jgi:hypothetical protein
MAFPFHIFTFCFYFLFFGSFFWFFFFIELRLDQRRAEDTTTPVMSYSPVFEDELPGLSRYPKEVRG